MPDNPTREALEELLDYLELVETQSGAVAAFLRANGTITDETLAPYLEQAATATDIKSRAIRARFDFLFNVDSNKSATDVNPSMPSQPRSPAASSFTRSQNEQEESKQNNEEPRGENPRSQSEGTAADAKSGEQATRAA